mmetsp:Transcript_17823/g.43629  ORF Transcript_17823/g.43629 Transcript_17823/m.43629 type:complete len:417 (-) Transcript_17823:120-1370(-)|eukprot:CAMPEP_0114500538 /NCGR_PEP_ID=MMETSP0109-20121206/8017_1 /TAXON_ID=29199 /ORGANISM="Chlorarachnion reptans, Strain CCCM449" /LENGTH=416 /DNA_ID=CAMNT_0001678205 /DNA_START=310 /DNA_END=1560 /DNA_ORIENTATION=+
MAEYVDQLGLTEEQKKTFSAFREQLKSELKDFPKEPKFDGVYDDLTLFRFLSAKKWNVDAAVEQYKGYLQYRKDEKVDEIFKWAEDNKETVELIDSLFPCSQHGLDKGGRPIVVENIGGIPSSKYASLVSMEDSHRRHVLFMEEITKTLRELTLKTGKPVYQVTGIVEMKGASLDTRHFVPYFQDLSKIDERNYPEIVHIVFAVNCPWVFPMLYGLVKHFIDPNTREKIRVYSNNYLDDVLKEVDKEVLNVKYGGDNTEELPTVKGVKLKGMTEEMEGKNVPARDSVQVTKKCEDKKGGKFEWSFKLESLDIDFKVTWQGIKDKKPVVVVDESRIDGHTGDYKAKGPGTFTLTFDNTFSYLTSKQVNFALIFNSATMLKAQAHIEARQKKEMRKREKEAKKMERRKEKEARRNGKH